MYHGKNKKSIGFIIYLQIFSQPDPLGGRQRAFWQKSRDLRPSGRMGGGLTEGPDDI